MNLKTWQQISEIKRDILNSVKILATEQVTPREVVGWDLLKVVKNVNALEEDFRKNTIKEHRLLCQIAADPFSIAEPHEIKEFNFSQWQLIVTLKSLLLSAVHTIFEDKSISREEIASRLLGHVYCLNQIEEGCIEYLENTEFLRIDELCDNIEISREKEYYLYNSIRRCST
jgi:hypothetical protein